MRRIRCIALGVLVAGVVAILFIPNRAPATIGEQRRRLPPPAQCPDEIAGIWKAHVYYAHVREWYIFELDIRRTAPGVTTLTGTIRAEFWDGRPDEEAQPAPPCRVGQRRRAIFENATGTYLDNNLTFNATDWRPEQAYCGPPIHAGEYLLDNFSGRVDVSIKEFQSVLNADAPEWTNVPTVFRQIRCHPGAPPAEVPTPAPTVETTPPPPPPTSSVGCDCGFI